MRLPHQLIRDRRGFGGQPELMIVVAIIGILGAIAIPKFAELIRLSSEGASKGNLGSIRAAVSFHRYHHKGLPPYHPAALTAGGKYLNEVSKAKAPNYHPDSAEVRLGLSSADSDDTGGWLYVAMPGVPEAGAIFVNCTHTDTKGVAWNRY